MYDILVKNGLMFDGTGSSPIQTDIGVLDDKVVALGLLPEEAVKTIDAKGLAIAPGFIDLHSHSDISFLLDPTAQSKVRQGVTLELAGNCGSSFCAPLRGSSVELLQTRVSQYSDCFDPQWTNFNEYLNALESAGSTLNLAVQVGHATVRACVVGLDARPPTGEELDQMKNLVTESLDAGAMGLSSGLFYSPGNYARLEEIIELTESVANRGKLYSTHMRDEGSHSVGLFVAINEAIEVGRRTRARVQVSHVKCMGPSVWGRADDLLEYFERTTREGIDMAGDQYPYTAGSTGLTGAIFPRWALDGGRDKTLEIMANLKTRERLLTDIDEIYKKSGGAESVVISRFTPNPQYEGMNMLEISKDLGTSSSEAALILYQDGDGQVVIHMMQDVDVNLIAQHPLISVASDGSSLSSEGVLSVGQPHPRSYGTNPRFLGEFVRERKLVSLTEAIRKMTTLPASRLGLTNRGRIAPGFMADLVIFDPVTVSDTATFDTPHSYPIGIPHVVVNGITVIEHGEFTGQIPGRVLRNFND